MRKNILFALMALLLLSANQLLAQKKDFTYEQLFPNGAPPQLNVTKSLPVIVKWLDDEHYVEARRDDKGTMKEYLVEVKTGKSTDYQRISEISPDKSGSFPKDAKNATYSPDGKYAAYTLNNNLY